MLDIALQTMHKWALTHEVKTARGITVDQQEIEMAGYFAAP